MPFLLAAGILLLFPAIIAINGFVLQSLWGWFLVPLGVPYIGVAKAIGLSVLAHMFVWQAEQPDSNGEKPLWEQFLKILMRPAFTFAFGWIVHQFMLPPAH